MIKRLAFAAILFFPFAAQAQQTTAPDPTAPLQPEWSSVILAQQHFAQEVSDLVKAYIEEKTALAKSDATADYWKAACDKTPGCSSPK